jgi:hypothetical protein
MVVSATAASGGRALAPHLSKQALSTCKIQLLELMQGINFGRIKRLKVSGGEPVLNPRPTIVRAHKLKGENGPRPELSAADFLLKQEIVELFGFLDELQDGEIDLIEIKHGLPFLIEVTEVPA